MKRGSAEQVNAIFTDAVKRSKIIVDELVKMIAASGYPPLTVPVGIRELKAMSQTDAVAFLRSELQRTMQTDATGDKKPHPQTVDLAVRYLESQTGVPSA